jgi:hypothetical protein
VRDRDLFLFFDMMALAHVPSSRETPEASRRESSRQENVGDALLPQL